MCMCVCVCVCMCVYACLPFKPHNKRERVLSETHCCHVFLACVQRMSKSMRGISAPALCIPQSIAPPQQQQQQQHQEEGNLDAVEAEVSEAEAKAKKRGERVTRGQARTHAQSVGSKMCTHARRGPSQLLLAACVRKAEDATVRMSKLGSLLVFLFSLRSPPTRTHVCV